MKQAHTSMPRNPAIPLAPLDVARVCRAGMEIVQRLNIEGTITSGEYEKLRDAIEVPLGRYEWANDQVTGILQVIQDFKRADIRPKIEYGGSAS